MEENETIVPETEEAVPQASETETDNPASAEEAHDGQTDGNGAVTIRTDEDGLTEDTEDTDEGITYRYNHRTYRATGEEARQLVQRGRRFETFAGHIDRLQRIAQERGQDLGTLISEIEGSYERQEIDKLAEHTGGNREMAKQLYDLRKEKAASKYKTTLQTVEEQEKEEREDETRRMGEQLAELQKEFPNIKEFRDIPKAVVRDAQKLDISLLDSYLRWQYRNQKASAAEQEVQKQAAASSVGSMQSDKEEQQRMDAQSAAFLASFKRNF
jgi:hypothetical protein